MPSYQQSIGRLSVMIRLRYQVLDLVGFSFRGNYHNIVFVVGHRELALWFLLHQLVLYIYIYICSNILFVGAPNEEIRKARVSRRVFKNMETAQLEIPFSGKSLGILYPDAPCLEYLPTFGTFLG